MFKKNPEKIALYSLQKIIEKQLTENDLLELKQLMLKIVKGYAPRQVDLFATVLDAAEKVNSQFQQTTNASCRTLLNELNKLFTDFKTCRFVEPVHAYKNLMRLQLLWDHYNKFPDKKYIVMQWLEKPPVEDLAGVMTDLHVALVANVSDLEQRIKYVTSLLKKYNTAIALNMLRKEIVQLKFNVIKNIFGNC